MTESKIFNISNSGVRNKVMHKYNFYYNIVQNPEFITSPPLRMLTLNIFLT